MHTDTSGLWPMLHTEDSQYWTRTFSIVGKTVNIHPTAEVFVPTMAQRTDDCATSSVCIIYFIYFSMNFL